MNWELDIAEDLYPLTHPEDGKELTLSAFYIIATEAASGRRFAHDFVFRAARVVDGALVGHRRDALASAEKLLARIQAAQAQGAFASPEGRAPWREVQPAYGSPAYQAQGSEAELVAAEAE